MLMGGIRMYDSCYESLISPLLWLGGSDDMYELILGRMFKRGKIGTGQE